MKHQLILFTITLFIACETPQDKARSKALNDSINVVAGHMADSIINKARIEAMKPTPGENWQFIEDTDKMTSKVEHRSYVIANEPLEFNAPYDGGVRAYLTVRRRRGETNVYLHVDRGQFYTRGEDKTIKVRFDDNKAETFSYETPNDGSSELIFINNESRFISKLKKANKTLIEAEFFDNGTHIMEFDTHNFIWKY